MLTKMVLKTKKFQLNGKFYFCMQCTVDLPMHGDSTLQCL